MCGIVAAVAQRDVVPILVEGLKRLEYRGYDSAGVAVLNDTNIQRARTCGKVAELEALLAQNPVKGNIGLAHTRWATHGRPSEENAHPHISNDRLAIVHNGIIENHKQLADGLKEAGYRFSSDTDTEVVAHLLDASYEGGQDLRGAIQQTVDSLEGAFALVVMAKGVQDRLFVTRRGAPMVIGLGIGEVFVASDILALLPVTQTFIYLEEGDLAEISVNGVRIWDSNHKPVERPAKQVGLSPESVGRGNFRHYMQKEIHEQPWAVGETLEGRLMPEAISNTIFGRQAEGIFPKVENVHIVACGTSYHAGLIARYWLESIGMACQVEVASEFRYRKVVVPHNTLLVTISQSGETADTLAALEAHRHRYLATLCICNVPESALVRGSDLCLLTHAGPEVGVASTKAFTTQLVALQMLCLNLGQAGNKLSGWLEGLRALPELLEKCLKLDEALKKLAAEFVHKSHALYLGRGQMFPVALEGALKLKEISYIHAEAYPAGELKHGPLALVDENMPVIAVCPSDGLTAKLRSNLEEVKARGGLVILFTDKPEENAIDGATCIEVPTCPEQLAPLIYTIPLQLLAYHVAVLKGTDVDQPRNLAKSVTVE